MDYDVKVEEMTDTFTFDRQGAHQWRQCIFRVGATGPFTVRVEDGPNWSTDMQRKIDEVVNGVRSIVR